MDNIRIRCPRCNWEHDGGVYWHCSCGTYWDTFSTGARCPSFGKVWEDTQCPDAPGGCREWSPHLDWYEGLEDIVRKLKEEIKESWVLTKVQQL